MRLGRSPWRAALLRVLLLAGLAAARPHPTPGPGLPGAALADSEEQATHGEVTPGSPSAAHQLATSPVPSKLPPLRPARRSFLPTSTPPQPPPPPAIGNYSLGRQSDTHREPQKHNETKDLDGEKWAKFAVRRPSPSLPPSISAVIRQLQLLFNNSSTSSMNAVRGRSLPGGGYVAGQSSLLSHSAPGGVGNPGLRGVPIPLGSSSSYLVPTHDASPTARPVYSGVGNDQHEHFPVKLGGSFNRTQDPPNLAWIGSRISGNNFIPGRYQSSFPGQGGPQYPGVTRPSSSEPYSILHLLDLMNNSVGYSTRPADYLPSHPFGTPPQGDSFYYPAAHVPPLINPQTQLESTDDPLHALTQYHEEYGLEPPDAEGQVDSISSLLYPSLSQISDELDSSSSSPFASGEPYIPAYHTQDGSLSEIEDPSEGGQGAQPQQYAFLPVLASLTSTSSDSGGCLGNSLCIVALSIGAALSASAAFAIPFSAGLLGRRKRSLDTSPFPEDWTSLIGDYLRYIDRDACDSSPQQPSDTPCRPNAPKIVFKWLKNLLREQENLTTFSSLETMLQKYTRIKNNTSKVNKRKSQLSFSGVESSGSTNSIGNSDVPRRAHALLS